MNPSTITESARATATPQAEYERRRLRRSGELARHQRRERQASWGRLVAFGTIVAVGWAVYRSDSVGPLWLLPAIALFVAAVVWHGCVRRSLARARRAVVYYEQALARLQDRWTGTGPAGSRYRQATHLYAADLDLFGDGSLFQLLCQARTLLGQETLAAWLNAPADAATIRTRQAAVAELRHELDLREQLGVLAPRLRIDADPQALRAWMAGTRLLVGAAFPVLAVLLAVASLGAFVGWIVGAWPLTVWGLVLALQGGLLLGMRRPMRELSRRLEPALVELDLVLAGLRLWEGRRWESAGLRALHNRLCSAGKSPSQEVARLVHRVDFWETTRRNQFVALPAFLLMLPIHLAYSIERWRARHRQAVTEWLAALGEFEALSSLAGYAYEHPEQPFAEIVEPGPELDARGLGHPLIPTAVRVTNDVRLGPERVLLLLSGSNMSGKSTLLRTVGTNVVLALAGAPVCAAALRVSPLGLATAMRHADSLQEGVSAFYAEIRRLRMISDLAVRQPPLLFLLDEILRGTNSHDRRIGAEAVIDDLLEHGALGMVTTHDLALAAIVERLAPRAANVHFEDQLVAGRLAFDYRLRPGVVPKGNGLVLMRLLGFQVAE